MGEHRVSIPHVRALDGLRGVAVVGVLAYHGGHLTGGYLGVDLFFVLSGYLITSLLLAEWRRDGHIALGAFWARRARRLLPAIALLLLGVALYSIFIAEPADLGRIRGDALSTLGYVANWHSVFAGQSYFDLFRAPSPLQHTWSLAIEEQFYVIWPLVFAALVAWWKARAGQAVLVVAIVLGIASTTLMAVLFSPTNPNRVYFGTDTRAFALFAGIAFAATVAIWGHIQHPARRALLEVVAGASVLLLAFAWSQWDGAKPLIYHGGFALAGLAATLVIAAATNPQRGPLAWVLSLPPLTWLGLISYGLYLWHWPVDVVLDAGRTGLSGWSLFALRTAVAIAIAVTSYFLVELPIRRGALRSRQWRIAVPVAFAVLTVVAFASTVTNAESARAGEPLPLNGFYASRPQMVAKRRLLDARLGSKTPRILVMGDSIAVTLVASAPTRSGSKLGVQGAAMIACGVVIGVPVDLPNGPTEELCGRAPALWREAADIAEPAAMLLIPGGWDLFDRQHHSQLVRFGTRPYQDLLNRRLSRALAIARDHHAHLFVASLPCLSPAVYLPEQVQRAFGDTNRVKDLNQLVRRFATGHPRDVSFIDLYGHVCPAGKFEPSFRSTDGVHFSPEGGAMVWRWLTPQVTASRNR